MIFFCGFFWGSSFPEAWGQTSTPSRFYADRVVNPSVRLLLKPSPWLGLSYNQIHQQKQSGSTYKEEIESQDSSLQVGNLAGTFFYELHFTPEYSQNSQLAESGFAEIKSHWDIQQYEALAGLYLFGWPFGIRFSQKNIRLRELDLKEIHQNLTMGFSGLWGENFRWGLGADLASESGDEKATSRWIEPFVGISMGSFGGDSPLFLELSVQRRPQILNVDGTKVNAHGEKMSTQASFEWTSKTGIWPLEPLLFRLSYITEQEKEMDVYVLEEEKNTITKVELGSSFLVPGLYWTLNYSTRTSSSSFKDQGVEVGASLFWVGNDIF